MNLSNKRQIILYIILGLIVLSAAGILAYWPARVILSANEAYGTSYDSLAQLTRMQNLLNALSSAERDFMTTGDKGYQQAFSDAAVKLRLEMDSFKALPGQDAEKQDRFRVFSNLVLERVQTGESAMAQRIAAKPQPPGEEETLIRQLDLRLNQLEDLERVKLQLMDSRVQGSLQILAISLAVGGIAALIIVVLSLDLFQREAAHHRRAEERLSYEAKFDPMTGLPHRKELVRRLEEVMGKAKKEGRTIAVLFMNLDRFKQVNTLFGHKTGDAVLKQLADRLKTAVAEEDIVARLGGDEFAVVHFSSSQPPDVISVAEKVRNEVSRNLPVGGNDVVLTTSIGISVFPEDASDAASLLNNADLALARAKAQGRNGIQLFDKTITKGISDFFVLEKYLFSALKNDEYLLQYQPYCDLASRKVSGAEALIRWKNKKLGLVSPARFIPSLEETGMIVDMGQWVLETACGQIKEWEKKKFPFPVSVNLSLIQFRHKHLVPMVADVVDNFKVDPRNLTLEVTETVCMHDMETAIQILKRLKDVGVSISVDDFGTGYSSLSYLKRLPVDSIKIDISFVRDVTRDQDAASMISAITSLARNLNLNTIAEGIETEEQLKILYLLRCNMGQGFFFSPSLSAPDFEKFLAVQKLHKGP